MTKLKYILKEINELSINELELILHEILKKVERERSIKSILNEYKGIGKGIWKMDAQDYINKERDQLRAKYQFLKGMDSIQIASALITNCEAFITNDRKL